MSEFVPLVVPSDHGPHVTLTAGVEAFGRFWTTTSRSAYKSNAVRRHGVAGYTVTEDDCVVATTGTAVVVDPFRPRHAAHDLGAATVAPAAVAQVGVSHVRQVLGYLESFSDVLPGWTLVERVVLAIAPLYEIRIARDDVDRQSRWGKLTRSSERSLAATVVRAHTPERVQRLVASALVERTAGVAGVAADRGPVAIPASWDGGGLALPASVLDEFDRDAGWAVMFDESDDRRPDEKYGFFLRGFADGGRLTATRLTWWDGFRSGTVRIGGI